MKEEQASRGQRGSEERVLEGWGVTRAQVGCKRGARANVARQRERGGRWGGARTRAQQQPPPPVQGQATPFTTICAGGWVQCVLMRVRAVVQAHASTLPSAAPAPNHQASRQAQPRARAHPPTHPAPARCCARCPAGGSRRSPRPAHRWGLPRGTAPRGHTAGGCQGSGSTREGRAPPPPPPSASMQAGRQVVVGEGSSGWVCGWVA